MHAGVEHLEIGRAEAAVDSTLEANVRRQGGKVGAVLRRKAAVEELMAQAWQISIIGKTMIFKPELDRKSTRLNSSHWS